jgi:hypothetical protein
MPPVHSVDAPSARLSLERLPGVDRIPPVPVNPAFQRTTKDVHRFEEVINGREYLIEVLSVGLGKWRAQIKRTSGGSAALMPFYGTTPDDAAQQLSRWLALAHGHPQRRTESAGAAAGAVPIRKAAPEPVARRSRWAKTST